MEPGFPFADSKAPGDSAELMICASVLVGGAVVEGCSEEGVCCGTTSRAPPPRSHSFRFLGWRSKQLFPLPTLDGNTGLLHPENSQAPTSSRAQLLGWGRPPLCDHSTSKCSHL